MEISVNSDYGKLRLASTERFTSLFSESQEKILEKVKRRALEAFSAYNPESPDSGHPAPRIYAVDGRFLYYRLKDTEAVLIERDVEKNALTFFGGMSNQKGHEGEKISRTIPLDPTKPFEIKPITPVIPDIKIGANTEWKLEKTTPPYSVRRYFGLVRLVQNDAPYALFTVERIKKGKTRVTWMLHIVGHPSKGPFSTLRAAKGASEVWLLDWADKKLEASKA